VKKISALTLIVLIALLFVFFIPDLYIKLRTHDRLFQDTSLLPHNKVGLLLGTSKYMTKGTINLYYQYRLNAAILLFNQNKIDYILISGDNGQIEYNEPKTIRDDLIAAGIPAERIFLDYAGFRTWDSIIRAKKVFGETSLTIISQKFHNERAIFIGNRNHMTLLGFNAQDVPKRYGTKTMLREKFARIKLILDIIVNKQPRYLGDTIKIE
jgi:SanA protein